MELKIRLTPLTDSLIRHEKIGFNFDAFDMIEHARKMERERTYLMDKVQELEKDKAWLIEKGEKLVRWVESPRHTHEEVRDHNGRLKDTGIWCQFYVAVRGIQRNDSDVPISGHNARCAATAPEAARDLCQGGSPGQLADVACSACPRCGSSDQGHNCTKMAGEKSPNGPLPMVDHSAGWPYTDPNIDCDC